MNAFISPATSRPSTRSPWPGSTTTVRRRPGPLGAAQAAMTMAATGAGVVQADGILAASESGTALPARPGPGDGLTGLAAEPAGAADRDPGAPGGR